MPDEAGRQVKGTIRGYHLWAFDRVKDDQGGEADALNYIIGRWLDKDREEAAAEFQISRKDYRHSKAKRRAGPENGKGD
jgi:hypothetical protein